MASNGAIVLDIVDLLIRMMAILLEVFDFRKPDR